MQIQSSLVGCVERIHARGLCSVVRLFFIPVYDFKKHLQGELSLPVYDFKKHLQGELSLPRKHVEVSQILLFHLLNSIVPGRLSFSTFVFM